MASLEGGAGGSAPLPPTPHQLAAAEIVEHALSFIARDTDKILRRAGEYAFGFPPGAAQELAELIDETARICRQCEHFLLQCSAREGDLVRRGTEAIRWFEQVATAAEQALTQAGERVTRHRELQQSWDEFLALPSRASRTAPPSAAPPPRRSPHRPSASAARCGEGDGAMSSPRAPETGAFLQMAEQHAERSSAGEAASGGWRERWREVADPRHEVALGERVGRLRQLTATLQQLVGENVWGFGAAAEARARECEAEARSVARECRQLLARRAAAMAAGDGPATAGGRGADDAGVENAIAELTMIAELLHHTLSQTTAEGAAAAASGADEGSGSLSGADATGRRAERTPDGRARERAPPCRTPTLTAAVEVPDDAATEARDASSASSVDSPSTPAPRPSRGDPPSTGALSTPRPAAGAPLTPIARQGSADALSSPTARAEETPTRGATSAAGAERQHGDAAERAQRILRKMGSSKGAGSSPSSDRAASPLPSRSAPTEPAAVAGGAPPDGWQAQVQTRAARPELPVPPAETQTRAAWDAQASRGNAELIDGNSAAIGAISSEVKDLGEVFTELARLIQSQSTPLQLIEGQVERAALATGAAAREMEKAAANQNGCAIS